MKKPAKPSTKSVRIEVAAFDKLQAWCDNWGVRITHALSRAAELTAARETPESLNDAARK